MLLLRKSSAVRRDERLTQRGPRRACELKGEALGKLRKDTSLRLRLARSEAERAKLVSEPPHDCR